jgi:hypothetical protein
VKCYFREYTSVVEVATKYRSAKAKRVVDIYRVIYGGLASLVLAQDTQQDEFRQIGESAVETMSAWKEHSVWNFENKLMLLQAELHALNNDFNMARSAFQASVESARAHNFIHEEESALERFGLFRRSTLPLKVYSMGCYQIGGKKKHLTPAQRSMPSLSISPLHNRRYASYTISSIGPICFRLGFKLV